MATETGKPWLRAETLLSVAMHVALLGACAWYFRNPLSTIIIAAGEGQGNGDSAIEVGTVDGRSLGFTPPRAVSYVGSEENKANNQDVVTKAPEPDPNAVVLPSTKSTPTPKNVLTIDRPTVQTPKQFSKNPLQGGTDNTIIDIGRTSGSPVPSIAQGVGMGSGANLGSSGVPGGSEYGRRIQMILSRNYNPPLTNDASATQFVIVQLRIARDGRILSLVNGRVALSYFKRRSSSDLINNAAERAVLASNPLPPFPNGFLMSSQEAIAEVWFKYPK